MSEHNVERREDGICVDGHWTISAAASLADAELALADAREVAARYEALIGFLRRETDELLARKLREVHTQCGLRNRDTGETWLIVAATAREHFGGEQ